jgi:hypothetical protein
MVCLSTPLSLALLALQAGELNVIVIPYTLQQNYISGVLILADTKIIKGQTPLELSNKNHMNKRLKNRCYLQQIGINR